MFLSIVIICLGLVGVAAGVGYHFWKKGQECEHYAKFPEKCPLSGYYGNKKCCERVCPPRQKICGHKCCPDESEDKEEVLSYQLLCLNFDTLKLPLRFSKAGREFCGGARETH